jgi:hypothetical protein
MHLLALFALVINTADARGTCGKAYSDSLYGKCRAVFWFGQPDNPNDVERAECAESSKTIAVLLPKSFDGLTGRDLAAAINDNSSLTIKEIDDVVEHVTWTGYPCTDDKTHLVIIEHFVGEEAPKTTPPAAGDKK